jgi:hypothetical protein
LLHQIVVGFLGRIAGSLIVRLEILCARKVGQLVKQDEALRLSGTARVEVPGGSNRIVRVVVRAIEVNDQRRGSVCQVRAIYAGKGCDSRAAEIAHPDKRRG